MRDLIQYLAGLVLGTGALGAILLALARRPPEPGRHDYWDAPDGD